MAAEGREIADRLDQIRLALSVGAHERGDARVERDLDPGVRAEVGQRQMRDVHGRSPTSPGLWIHRRTACGSVDYFVSTAWPPNWLRSAATIFICGESLLPRGEPREQRRGDRGQRHRVVDGGFHRPAALTGVLCVTAQLLQVLVLVQGVHRQVQQPGTDDRAFLPGAEDLAHVGDGVDLSKSSQPSA